MEEKRKGYKTQKQQTEATKRYLEKNVVASVRADRSRLKSRCLKFINESATLDELKEIKNIINEKLHLKSKIEGAVIFYFLLFPNNFFITYNCFSV